MAVDFIVGGVIYACEPLNFYWQRKVQKDYIAAIEHLGSPAIGSILEKIDTDGQDMASGDAMSLLEALEPLLLSALKIVAACEDQRTTLSNEEIVKTGGESYLPKPIKFEELERHLTPNEAMGLMSALPAWIVRQQPKASSAASGEAVPAGHALPSPISTP